MASILDWTTLEAVQAQWGPHWLRAQPFPHLVIDGLLVPQALAAVQAALPPEDAPWTLRHHLHSRKRTLAAWPVLPDPVRSVIRALYAPRFINWLTALLARDVISPDLNLYGGGLHQTLAGGFLDWHVDFLQHPETQQQRVLNLLLYLTPGYDMGWGGALELCAPGPDGFLHVHQAIAPLPNRAVLFATSEHSWHGHTAPWTGPVPRSSIALYYYAAAEPAAPSIPTTIYRPRREEYGKRLRKWVSRQLREWGLR